MFTYRKVMSFLLQRSINTLGKVLCLSSMTMIAYAAPTTMTTDVVVVGGGYSGLLAARTIARSGYHVVLIEALDRIGGRAYSVSIAPGVVADLGAGWVISPTHQHMIQLAKEYRISLYPTYIQGEALIMEGQSIHRVSMDELSFSPDSPPIALKPAAEVIQGLSAMSASLDPAEPWLYQKAEELDNMTFLEWLNTHYPKLDAKNRQVIERTIEGYIGSLSTTSVLNVLTYIKMSHGLKNYADMKNWLRVEGGVAAIAQKIAKELKNNLNVKILLNNRVTLIDQSNTRVTVYATNATVQATMVVVAVPPMVASGIHFQQHGNPIVPRAGAMTMAQRVPMTPGFKAMFVYSSPFWRKKGLSGHAVSQTEPFGTVWDASPKDGHVGCLILLNSPFNSIPKLAEIQMQERRELLANSLAKFFGKEALEYTNYVEQLWDAQSLFLGSVGVPSMGSWTNYGQYLRPSMGRIHWASSERALESWAQMDGAVESGIRVGNEVVQVLSKAQKVASAPQFHLDKSIN